MASSAPLTPEEFLQLKTRKSRMESELWNCISLQLGANIGPSIRYRSEYWRVFACFFLHENTCHLLLNILMIVYYDKQTEKKKVLPFYLFCVLTLVNANLTSNLISPNFLKLGSSLLSSLLLTLSFFQGLERRKVQFWIDATLMAFFLGGTLHSGIDNTVHLFGMISGFVYWLFENRGQKMETLFLFHLVYLGIVLGCLKSQQSVYEEKTVVEFNYGCPNSFFDLIAAK